MPKDTYTVELRTGISYYTAEHFDFDSEDEVRKFVKSKPKRSRVHSVLLYENGATSNPRNVTRKFT